MSRILSRCFSAIFLVLFTSVPVYAQNGLETIVIDAGHGGKDKGNLGTGRYKTYEKDVALNVSLLLGDYIQKNFPEVKVIYTRRNDRFLKLHERTKIANSNNADLFISIHCNAAANKAAFGTETFVMGMKYEKANLELTKRENSVIYLEDDYDEHYEGLDPNNPESNIIAAIYQNAYQAHSISFAKLVEDQFSARVGRRSRGVKQSVLFVMNRTTMPSVLIELGFLTNKKEEDFLISEKGQVYLASAIFRAFREYKEQIDSKNEIMKQGQVPVISKETEEKFEKENDYGITFHIQLLSSDKKIKKEAGEFKKLAKVEEREIENRFKYTVGNFSTYNEAKKYLKEVKAKGFPTAFIIALKNKKVIPVKEAIQNIK